jgi:hypothetical protein
VKIGQHEDTVDTGRDGPLLAALTTGRLEATASEGEE